MVSMISPDRRRLGRRHFYRRQFHRLLSRRCADDGSLEEVVVNGQLDRLQGSRRCPSSMGVVGAEQFAMRPVLRTGELYGSRARADRHPTQRRRQSEPILPARFQSRSRHRPRDHASTVCRSTCRRTDTARATPISTS